MPVLSPSDGLVDVPGEASSGGAPASSQILYVQVLADLGTPVGGVITTPDGIAVSILENIDLAGNRLVLGSGASLDGVSDLSTTLSGSTAVDVPLVSNAGNAEISRITMTQTGAGDLFLQDAGGSVVEFFDVNRNGRYIGRAGQLFQASFGNGTSTLDDVMLIDGVLDFIILADAELMWPQITGAICVNFTENARVQRCTFDTATPLLRNLTSGFSEVLNSIGIFIHKDAEVEIFTQMNAGFRPISDGSRHLVVQDPASVDFGLLEGNTFSNEDPFNPPTSTTGTLYGCEPVVAASNQVSGRELGGLTYDGDDLYAVDVLGTDVVRFDGTSNSETGVIGTPADPIDVAYYKGDFFVTFPTQLGISDGFTSTFTFWSLTEIKDTAGARAFASLGAVATNGVEIYILGQRFGTLDYTIFTYPSNFATDAKASAPNAITELDVDSLIITSGEVYLDYDGVNFVIAVGKNSITLPTDPLVNTNWNAAQEAQVNQSGGSVVLENLIEGGTDNFADFTFLTTVGRRYDIIVDVVIADTEVDIDILDSDEVQIATVTSSGTEVLTIPFIATSNTSLVRWQNVDTTVGETSLIQFLIQDTGTITVLKNVSNEPQYSFVMENPTLAAARPASGVAVITENLALTVPSGFATASQAASEPNSFLQVYDTSLTLDHSASNWEMMNNIGDTVIESTARGGSSFTDTPSAFNFTPSGTGFEDIIGGVGDPIIYTPFTAREKCFLVDETNGMVRWTGVREKAQLLTGAITFSASATGTTTEIAIVINGIVQDDSIASLDWDNQRPVQTLTTLPISRDLTALDTVVVQGNQPTGAGANWTILAVRLSIA